MERFACVWIVWGCFGECLSVIGDEFRGSFGRISKSVGGDDVRFFGDGLRLFDEQFEKKCCSF